MILSTLVLLFGSALPATDTDPKVAAPAPVERKASDDVQPATVMVASAKPDVPAPKIMGEEAEPPAASIAVSQPIRNAPVQAASTESFETPRKRLIWYGLIAAGHGTAALDAWTTRRAVSGGYGTEGDPLQRPFANSNAIYATTQLSPLLMDYVGHRMMRSRSPMLRRFWWVPQAASASFSLGAGIHNYNVVH